MRWDAVKVVAGVVKSQRLQPCFGADIFVADGSVDQSCLKIGIDEENLRCYFSPSLPEKMSSTCCLGSRNKK